MFINMLQPMNMFCFSHDIFSIEALFIVMQVISLNIKGACENFSSNQQEMFYAIGVEV